MATRGRSDDIAMVLRKYSGKWIAWDHAARRILGSGTTLVEAERAAAKAGESRPILEKIPPVHRLVGSKT
jgi:hypothetical protein